MIGDPGYSVKEALTILSPVANSHYRSGALLALPDKEQNFYSWFLSMPQQFPPALNAPFQPTYGQYLGAFAAPPQPLFDFSKQAHATQIPQREEEL
ncbi:uncharacterized protein N7487_008642 [Penicillium crustosum]|uniref:uncharacterized protein n=1 Tax=Penicillium crustosum TaxID=36656 RepID=UPI0023A15AD7|nr:uncharacterized protein N7487_008642 [Penicillium crustosum]KAJ5402746.1 hypothetical protein N7487_008642 [Penicillium crustosum]